MNGPIDVEFQGVVATLSHRSSADQAGTRWWETELVRTDLWEIDARGRWWIVPGKV